MTTRDTIYIALFVLGLRFLVFVVAAYNFDFVQHSHENIFSIWDRWDAKPYQRIVNNFYSDTDLNDADHKFLSRFPPLYPVLSALLMQVAGFSFRGCAIVVSLLSLVGASLLLFKLALNEYKTRITAFLSVLFLNLFPTAYFAQAPYTEALFILLIISCMYAVRIQKNFNLAWLYSSAAILTRTVGVTLVLIPIVKLYVKFRAKQFTWNDIYGGVFPLLAVFVVLGYNWYYYADPLTFVRNYSSTDHSIKPAVYPFAELIRQVAVIVNNFPNFINDDFFMFHEGWGALLSLVAILTLILGYKKLPIEYNVFAWGYLIFIHNTSWAISMPRYLWVIIPVLLIWANIKNKAMLFTLATACFALQLYFAIRFTSGNWGF